MELPRLIAPGMLWMGGCVELVIRGERLHSHFGCYAIRGSRASLLVDTGHPMHATAVEAALDGFLSRDMPLYIFPTHVEYPHSGLIPKWLRKYPDAMVVGDVRDYPLHYPELADRFRQMGPGDALDLGDRRFLLVPAIWCDLKETLWGYDTGAQALFVADGFSATHHHTPGRCGLLASEQPIPDPAMMRTINELALQWTCFSDASDSFAGLDALLALLQPRIIAPAHGAIIDRPETMVPYIKAAMLRPDRVERRRVVA